MEIKKLSDLLIQHKKNKKLSERKLEAKTGISRNYINSIFSKTVSEVGSYEAIKKIIEGLELNDFEKKEIWVAWLREKKYYDLISFISI